MNQPTLVPPTPLPQTLVILDDPAGPQAPGVWAKALGDAGWSGAVHAPMPAGWFDSPPIEGGNYDLADSIVELIRSGLEVEPPSVAAAVVGIGVAGWSATLWALAGRARSLILVDGCGGPWLSVEERSARAIAHLRAQRDLTLTPVTDAVPTETVPTDPRRLVPPLAHGIRDLALEAADALVVAEVATLIADWRSTPEANQANHEVADRLGKPVHRVFPVDAVAHDVEDVRVLAAVIAEWITT